VNLAIHENPAFWVLWLVTLVICVHQMVRAIQTPIGILGFVPVICAMFGYLFVIQAAAVATTMSHRIDPDYLAMGELVALTCLLAILAGWHKGAGKVVMSKTERPIQVAQGRMLWYCGISAICVGIFGQYYYFIMVLPEREVVVAYVYMVFHVAFPGLAICVYLASADRAFRTGGNILALLILGSIFIWPWIYAVRRAPTFTFLIILVYGFYLARPRKVNRMMVLTGLFSACVLMLFFFFIRDYSQSWGGSWSSSRLKEVEISNVLFDKAYEEGDNEFLYCCAIVGTCYELDRYQWGTSYLSLSIHWIPRSWWPDKPRLATGWFEPPTSHDIFEVTGVMPTPGSALSGIGESFMDFGWFTPVFWFCLGWCFGKLYRLAIAHGFSMWAIIYIGMIAGTHYLITQGFGAFFVPACIYISMPIGMFLLSGTRTLGEAKRPNKLWHATKSNRPVLNRV
jgi:hypothetical protein